MRKRFPALTLLLTLLLCVTVRAAGPQLEVHLPAGPVEAGEEFTVTVDLTGNPGVNTIEFTLAFDRARMDCVSAEVSDIALRMDLHVTNPDAQKGAALAAVSMEPMTGDGELGVFRFKAKEKLSDFHFSMEEISMSDRNGNQLDVVVSVVGDGENKSGSTTNDSGASSGGSSADNGSTSNGSGATDSGSTSNGSGATDSGSTPSGSGSTDSGNSSSGSGATDSGNSSSGSGSTDSGSTPSGSNSTDSGSTPSGSGATDSGKTSNGSGSTDSGKTSNGSKSTDSGNTSKGSGAFGSGSADSGSTSGGSATPEDATPPFIDIEGTWAESYIRTAAARNLFQGYSDGTFRPNNRLSRAQFMMVLWNLAGRPATSTQSPFVDMQGQIENFQKAVAWAYAQGYVNGTSPETFSPGEPLTRQAAVKILFAYNGSRRGPEALLTSVYDEQYADSGRISAWARNAMYWAVYQNILSGTSPTTLDPGGTVTRAQLAAIMVRYTDRFPES